MPTTIHKPGRLVRYRNREWMVLPSDDAELLRIKPLGGSEEEETAVFLPLAKGSEAVTEARFTEPQAEQIGDFETAKLLFDACRLSFRNASGPFRCIGKLSFRPRSYQLVPLVMALKQETTRLMIADDVGIGKTIEALIILKELMERGEIKRFAVVCPPHLCEQWQQELRDKLDIQAEIIRSSTAASLDRRLPDDRSIFYHLPYQVISIDYIKADKYRGMFLDNCPELVIVDEAHTCALPEGAKSKNQQKRHRLIDSIAQKQQRHLILLTATPHSGKDAEFTSLLGLLKPEFAKLEFSKVEQSQRRQLAKFFIQRKRERLKHWLKEDTPFPDRKSKEINYPLSTEYIAFYQEAVAFARGLSQKHQGEQANRKRLRYWAALALLRGLMSSPACGLEMLQNRKDKYELDEEEVQSLQKQKNPVLDYPENDHDTPLAELVDQSALAQEEIDSIDELRERLEKLKGIAQDTKLKQAIKEVKRWHKEGFQPIIFCKYIATANYIGEHLKEALPQSVQVEVVTSEQADEQRRETIAAMESSTKRVLVATDCLSEGINLQDLFTAVLHYDLPWNPNRLEQREGRVDRFGQSATTVQTNLLWSESNPIDAIVLRVLIRKVKDIQKATGVSIALGEDTQSIMDAVMQDVLESQQAPSSQQLTLFAEEKVNQELETARERAERLRSIFAQESLRPEEIERDLAEVDEAIGDLATIERFTMDALAQWGVQYKKDDKGYLLNTTNLPNQLRPHFLQEGGKRKKQEVNISFQSPTPSEYRYIGRNHQFVEQLCHLIIGMALDPAEDQAHIGRVSAIQTENVSVKTTLIMFRVRNVIKQVNRKQEVIAEEMYLWGYKGSGKEATFIDYATAKTLLMEAKSLANFSPQRQQALLENELQQFEQLKPHFMELAEQRAEKLVEAHGRFRDLVGGRRYEKATPVLPPDVMGVYVLLPKPKLAL